MLIQAEVFSITIVMQKFIIQLEVLLLQFLRHVNINFLFGLWNASNVVFRHKVNWKITQANKKNLSALGWRLSFSFVFFPAESESGVKSWGLAAYFEHNLKKLSKSRVSVEKLENKKIHCYHHIKNTLFLCILACWIQICYGKRDLTAEFRR